MFSMSYDLANLPIQRVRGANSLAVPVDFTYRFQLKRLSQNPGTIFDLTISCRKRDVFRNPLNLRNGDRSPSLPGDPHKRRAAGAGICSDIGFKQVLQPCARIVARLGTGPFSPSLCQGARKQLDPGAAILH